MNTSGTSKNKLEAELSRPVEDRLPRAEELRAEIMQQVRREQATHSGPRRIFFPALAACATAACILVAFLLLSPVHEPPAQERSIPGGNITEWSYPGPWLQDQAISTLSEPYNDHLDQLGQDLNGLSQFLENRFTFVDDLLAATDSSS